MVGGGDGVEDFLWSDADGITIACHRAAWRMPYAPTFQLSADRTYWNDHKPRAGSIGVWVDCSGGTLRTDGVLAVPCASGMDHWANVWTESLDEGLMVGGCSGVPALHLAYLLRADEVHLVGIDLDGEGDRPWGRWQQAFRFAANQCRARGVRVVCHGRWRP